MTPEELLAAGYDVPGAAYERLVAFVQTLLAENERVNLTGARDEAAVWPHVCDSLAFVERVRRAGARQALDLGSGGGLPGLPLACVCDDVEVTLLDATAKKVAAVERIATALGLGNVRTLCGRAETLAHEGAQREQYDAVAVRAVAVLALGLEYAAGYLRVGGECWLYKSAAGLAAERGPAEGAATACGLVHVEDVSYLLPGESEPRVLVGYRKAAALRPELPRSPGQAKKRPL